MVNRSNKTKNMVAKKTKELSQPERIKPANHSKASHESLTNTASKTKQTERTNKTNKHTHNK